jgi:hypothetical protein
MTSRQVLANNGEKTRGGAGCACAENMKEVCVLLFGFY